MCLKITINVFLKIQQVSIMNDILVSWDISEAEIFK